MRANSLEANETELAVTVRTTLEREPAVSKCHGAFTLIFPVLSSMSYFPSARLVLRPEMLWHLDGIGPIMLPAFTKTTIRRHLPDIASAGPGSPVEA